MSPFERHGIVVPLLLTHVVGVWLSSNVRNVLPVVSLRKNAKWLYDVAATVSGFV